MLRHKINGLILIFHSFSGSLFKRYGFSPEPGSNTAGVTASSVGGHRPPICPGFQAVYDSYTVRAPLWAPWISVEMALKVDYETMVNISCR